MKLSEIIKFVSCLKNSVGAGAEILTIDDAKKKYEKFNYAVVNAETNIPLWLCESAEDAQEIIEQWQPYCWVILKTVDLQKGE